jgi:predicted Zn-dependent protease
MILIRGEGELLPDTYAVTSRLTILNNMVSAQIIIPNEHKYMPRLLEHELGHAFGMRHVEKTGHMMHPIHERGGELFWIPD